METKANYVLVGFFTVVAILAAFGFVYWTAALGDRGETALLRFRIPGSASGLSRGSAVLFNGVKVGDVRRVYLDLSNPTFAVADAEIDRLTPITHSTKADVGLAGLTGQANIELRGGNPSEPNLLDVAEENDTVAEIEASPSAVTNLLQTAQSLLTRADSVVSQLEGFTTDARQPLTQTVKNVERFSEALSRNADGIDSFLKNVGALSESIAGVSGQLDSTLKAAEELITAVDRDKVASVVSNFEQFSQRLDKASEGIDTVVANVDQTVRSIGTFSDNATQTLAKLDGVLDGVDPATVKAALGNFEEASTSVNQAAKSIADVSDTVGKRKDDIDKFITDASQLADQLNRSSVRLDSVLAKLDGMIGEADGEGIVAEARATLKSFREMAETLNARVNTISGGLERFSGQGLREVEALVRDARRSINRIEGAVTDFEQNPQRIITGGDGSIRRYDGRVRR
ncbi:MlaD family protein [Nitratireductor pacificus]|uniref:Mammalian cell entry related domain-containing protein n=1 Tax=Nitratireductor pacificus pht-3B TaxID=391937 RepID=K2LJL7_9HYPH|nr:MlaD family protein [Nitratireductor pacificus]EKF17949.1 mammalian cell entry related domain-containing protein [Nitratireductor pacificus pht-3B]